MKAERLLQSQGFGTRRECRALIQSGALHIDGGLIEDPLEELEISPGKIFTVLGECWQYREKAYLALHKPAGYECSRKPLHHPSVFDLLPQQLRNRNIQCVGRLDHDTTGLLLLSDDGSFIHHWSSGKKRIPKVYEVATRHPVGNETVDRLLNGVQLHGEPLPIRAVACEIIHDHGLRLTIAEGKYHQVKRMIAAVGNRVEGLSRSRIGGLTLPSSLQPGQWRWLEKEDFDALSRL